MHKVEILKRILNLGKINGKARTTKWIYNKALQGYFLGIEKGDVTMATYFANQVDSMITILNSLYGENWDFNFLYNNNYQQDRDILKSVNIGFYLTIQIYYPEITIRNIEEDTHDIKDLFVTLVLIYSELSEDIPTWSIYDIKGFRTTYTGIEYANSYVHSHLNSELANQSVIDRGGESFCLGNNTDIVIEQEKLHVKYDPMSFELFLFTLNSMLEWESLEGAPYIEMTSLSEEVQNSEEEVYDSHINFSSIYRVFREDISNCEFDYVIKNNRYIIKHNQKFIDSLTKIQFNKLELLKQLGIDNTLVRQVGYTYYKYQEELCRNTNNNSFLNDFGTIPSVLFRNKRIQSKVVREQSRDLIKKEEYKTYPKVQEYVKKKFEKELYETSVKRSGIIKYCQSRNATRGTS